MCVYVYRYISNGHVVYVGITNNMERRVKEHTKDKLSILQNPVIEFFPVHTRFDAELIETYLIRRYKTGRYFNVSKAQNDNKGHAVFLSDLSYAPWIRYNGELPEYSAALQAIDGSFNREPTILDLLKKIEKEKTIIKEMPDGRIKQYLESRDKIQDRQLMSMLSTEQLLMEIAERLEAQQSTLLDRGKDG